MAKLKSPKNKGSTFERKVAKILTEAFGLPFQRTPSSGAYTGGKNAVRKASLDERQVGVARGDIIPPEGLSNLVIECKHRKDFNAIPMSAFTGKWAALDDAIKQVLADASDKDSVPLIIFQGNGTKPMAVVQDDVAIHIKFSSVWLRYNDWAIMSLDYLCENSEGFGKIVEHRAEIRRMLANV